MGNRPEHLRALPPMTGDVCTIHLLQEQGYITMVFRTRSGADMGVFTIHRVEATKLGERICELLESPDGTSSLVEGARVGGPPRPDQLMP